MTDDRIARVLLELRMNPRLRGVLIVALVTLLWLLNVAVAWANYAWDFGVA